MIQEASESAELIIRDAEDFAKSTLEKQKQLGIQEATADGAVIIKKAANEAEVERLRKLANTKITANWIGLSKKKKIISAVISKAMDRLKAMTRTQKYVTVLEKLIIEGGAVLGGSELEVVLNEQDSTLGLDLADLAKKIGEQTGIETKLGLSEERIDVLGGVILRTKDGKIVMDNTYEDLLRRKERELRFKISEILFQ